MSRLASHAQDYLFSYDPQGTLAINSVERRG